LRFVDQKLKDSVATQHWLSLTDDSKVRIEVEEFAAEHQATMHFLSVAHSDFATWVNDVISKIRTLEVTRAILTDVSALQPAQVQQLMWAIQQTNAEFVAYDHLGLATSQSRLQYYDGLNWVGIGEPRINESLLVVKRLFDIILVIPALILLTPIYLIIAILIKIDSPGKFLYSQQRIGQNGKLFTFPKFRSMKKGADLERLSVVGRPDENMADRYKNDARITRVGKVLRRYSLDELPQLWCVLIGTMSLVGPRPILPEEEPQLGNFDFRRHIAKPGLTGIWQVSGRKETSWDDRMAFDIRYVEEWSIALDMILIARTFKVVLIGKGAY
jgi:exopolysaccharide biosynthesis polyprenyl glycosylphosphotransferase